METVEDFGIGQAEDFILPHQYALDPTGTSPETRDIQIAVIDGDHGTATVTRTVTVQEVIPPEVTSVTVNNGSEQRSDIHALAVVFNQEVSFDDIAQTVQVVPVGGSPVDLDASRYTYDSTTFTRTIDLTVVNPGRADGSILTADGSYDLLLARISQIESPCSKWRLACK